MDYKYIFYAPYYQNHSNGIKCFWQAAFNFSQSRDVTVLQFYNGVKPDLIPKEYESMKIIDDINKIQISKDHIVIYPDCVSTNPLNHHNIARYLMCKQFILNGQGIELNKYDYCFAYSNAVSEKLDQYLIFPKDLLNLKPQKNEVRDNKLLIYYGKVRHGLNFKGLQKFTENFDDVRIITREYPSKKSNLYQLISESRLLISFDPLTSLIHESTLLGTPVYIYDETFKEEYDKFNFKLHGFYYNLKDSDLTRVYKESFNLAERAHNEIKDLSNSQHVRTSELIIKIENHFSDNKTCYEKYTSNQKKDIDFFKKNFGLIPIFNIGTERNIVRYHVINKYKIFGILLFLMFRLLRKIKNFKFKINLMAIKNIFTSEEKFVIRKFLKNNKTYLSFLHTKYSINESQRIFNSKNIVRNDIIEDYDESKASKYTKPSLLIKYFWK